MMKKVNRNNIFLVLSVILIGYYAPAVEDDSILNRYKLNDQENEIIHLPKDLKEVSGLAYLDENHILTHNDEEGIVFKINIQTGKVVSEYAIGKKEVEKDFEGIANANDSVYLVTSKGMLFKFYLSDEKNKIKYEKIDTPLSSKNDVEGLCYDEKSNSLLLACKDETEKEHKNYKGVYEFNLNKMKFIKKLRYLISLKELKKKFDIKNFSPSGIEINPVNGNVFLISANPEAIVEVDSNGNLLNAKELNDKNHKQPEGILFLKDGTMILADEANGKKAKLTIIPIEK